VCPPQPGLNQYGSYCLHFDDTNRTHSEAEAYCEGYNSTLSYPTTNITDWQKALAQIVPIGRLGPWMGAEFQSDGEWRWPDGSLVQEEAWNTWWPDNPFPWPDRGNCSECGDVPPDDLFNTNCSDYRTVLCQVPSVNSCGCINKGYLLVVSLLVIQLLAVHMPTLSLNSIQFG
ncbi:unnamed protein product, partial [Meganyctiphanes norvegica]